MIKAPDDDPGHDHRAEVHINNCHRQSANDQRSEQQAHAPINELSLKALIDHRLLQPLIHRK